MSPEISRRLQRLRERIPRPTVRRRLTLLNSSIFLILGAALLTITTLLWGSSTNRRTTDITTVLPRILLHFSAVPGQVQLPSIVNSLAPFQNLDWIAGRGPYEQRAATGLLRVLPAPSLQPSSDIVSQQRFVGGQLQIVATQQHTLDLHQLLWYSGLALVITTVIAILAGWLMAGRVLSPLHTITAAAQDITATNLHERLRMTGPGDELKDLGDTFDDLLDRLEGSF